MYIIVESFGVLLNTKITNIKEKDEKWAKNGREIVS